MSEKQFDHIENRIREAAENNEPDYDEKAWELMEARLNNEDDKKPRFLLWALALLLVCITSGGIYWWTGNREEKFAGEKGQPIPDKPLPDKRNIKDLPKANDRSLSVTSASKNERGQLKNPVALAAGKQFALSEKTVTAGSKAGKPKKISRVVQKGKLSSKMIAGEMDTDQELVDITEPLNVEHVEIKEHTDNATITSDTKKDNLQVIDSTIVKSGSDSSDKKRIEKNNRKSSRFYLLAAIGADAGSVKLLSFKNSGITPKYGVGIGYQVNKRISLQTGFYTSWKKYVAGPDDYNYKAGSYWSIVKIIKVDAECLVYDIPLTMRYDFIQRSSASYFATAGLSSFIMKKEEYNYHYTRNNMYYQSQKSYTGSKAFLSVFNLSAGVEKNITPAFSLLAEPSVAIPLAGVGDGSIKLYSTALQLGIKYKPAKRKK